MTSTGWKHAYQKSLVKVILAKGEPVLENEGVYGWTDYDFLYHLRGGRHWGNTKFPAGPCEVIVKDDSIHENSIYEFEGTDASNSYHQVSELRGLECACGARTDFVMRYKGSLGDVLEAIQVLEDIDPDAVVPADEVDAMVSISVQQARTQLANFQTAIQTLANTYATAASSTTSDSNAKILALVAADLLFALRESEK